MKTTFLAIALFFSTFLFAQDSLNLSSKTKFVAFTPLNTKIEKVNGLSLGYDLMNFEDSKNQTNVKANGLNIGLNPIGFLIWCFYDPSRNENTETNITQNGVSISLGGFLNNTDQNGVNISLYNYGNKMNGVSMVVLYTDVEEMNGLYISGLANDNKKGKGVMISAVNNSESFKGLQIGILNKSKKMKGVQVGLVNKSEKLKGFQLGFWNKNGKRTLPIFNF